MDKVVTSLDLEELKKSVADVACIYGSPEPGMLKWLQTWVKKKESRFLVVVEEDEAQFLSLKQSLKDPKVRVYYYQEGNEEIFSKISWEFVFLSFEYAVGSAALQDKAAYFFQCLEHYHRGVDLLAADSQDMGQKVLKNAILNLSRLPGAKLFSSLENSCAKMPAIICGAGASLDTAAPDLKEARERALVIAGGTAVNALDAHGVSPHLYTAIDPDPPYDRFLRQEMYAQPFFYQGRFASHLLEKVAGPLVWMPSSGSYPLEGWLASECGIFAEPLESGWTVANVSLAIAHALGCDPIILVGMDFSCEADKIYAAGIAGEENKNELIELEGGIFSKKDWLMSAEWMSAFAKRHPDRSYFHATQKGVQLDGFERCAFKDVLINELKTGLDCDGHVHAVIAEAQRTLVTEERVKEVKAKLSKSFERCLLLCDSMLQLWQKYYPQSALEKSEYIVCDVDLEQEVCCRYFLAPLWDVWKQPILRTSFHPLGQHVHRLLFFKKAIELHLSYLKEVA